jgi:hypothetical protein
MTATVISMFNPVVGNLLSHVMSEAAARQELSAIDLALHALEELDDIQLHLGVSRSSTEQAINSLLEREEELIKIIGVCSNL